MKIPHINLPNLTTEALSADLDKRMRESVGAPVLYPHETVEGLLSLVQSLESALAVCRFCIIEVEDKLPAASTGSARQQLARTLLLQRRDLDKILGVKNQDQSLDF